MASSVHHIPSEEDWFSALRADTDSPCSASNRARFRPPSVRWYFPLTGCTALCSTNLVIYKHLSFPGTAGKVYIITESLRWENTFKVVESSHQPSTANPPLHRVPVCPIWTSFKYFKGWWLTQTACLNSMAAVDQSNWNMYRINDITASNILAAIFDLQSKNQQQKIREKKLKIYTWKLPFPVWCTHHIHKKHSYLSGTQNNHCVRGPYFFLLLKLLCWLSKLGILTLPHYISLLCNP